MSSRSIEIAAEGDSVMRRTTLCRGSKSVYLSANLRPRHSGDFNNGECKTNSNSPALGRVRSAHRVFNETPLLEMVA